MKIISLIALGLACALSGRYIAVRLSRRVRILEKIILMFGTIETEIGYLSRPTEELIKRLADKDELAELDFLPVCLSLCENGESINEAWIKSLMRSDKITGEDSCILYSFGETLGRSDVDGQLAPAAIIRSLHRKDCARQEKSVSATPPSPAGSECFRASEFL